MMQCPRSTTRRFWLCCIHEYRRRTGFDVLRAVASVTLHGYFEQSEEKWKMMQHVRQQSERAGGCFALHMVPSLLSVLSMHIPYTTPRVYENFLC